MYLFGTTVEADLHASVEGAKNKFQATTRQQRVLARYGLVEQKFRDPAAAAKQPSQAAGTAEAEQVDSETKGLVKL